MPIWTLTLMITVPVEVGASLVSQPRGWITRCARRCPSCAPSCNRWHIPGSVAHVSSSWRHLLLGQLSEYVVHLPDAVRPVLWRADIRSLERPWVHFTVTSWAADSSGCHDCDPPHGGPAISQMIPATIYASHCDRVRLKMRSA